MDTHPPDGSRPEQFSDERSPRGRRHWDRPRPYVALVVVEFENGERASLCTYCLDRRSEPHPRCRAPSCSCRWHALLAAGASVPSYRGKVQSFGLTWQSAQPWRHPRTVTSALEKDFSKEPSSRFRRARQRRMLRVYWIKRPEPSRNAPAPVPAEPAPEVVTPLPVGTAESPSPARAPRLGESRTPLRRHRPVGLRWARAPDQGAITSPAPAQDLAAPWSRKTPLAVLGIGIAVFLAVFTLREQIVDLLIQGHGSTPPGMSSPWRSSDEELSAVLLMPGEPLPRQLAPPCPRGLVAARGACWRRYALIPGSKDEIRERCQRATDVYEPEAGDCVRSERVYEPVFLEERQAAEPRKRP